MLSVLITKNNNNINRGWEESFIGGGYVYIIDGDGFMVYMCLQIHQVV